MEMEVSSLLIIWNYCSSDGRSSKSLLEGVQRLWKYSGLVSSAADTDPEKRVGVFQLHFHVPSLFSVRLSASNSSQNAHLWS